MEELKLQTPVLVGRSRVEVSPDDKICVLGSCFADNIGDKMAEVLGVPDGYELVCMLPVGKAAEETGFPKKKPFGERAWFNGFGKTNH